MMRLPLPFAWTIRTRLAVRRRMHPEFRVSAAPLAGLTHVNVPIAVGAGDERAAALDRNEPDSGRG
ncbi:hypothetical protein DIE14_24345 [Burkholderia sp. Bp9017]|nr:hypothetical protein DIE14_24345 [Burkholderia sp. Bp9017]